MKISPGGAELLHREGQSHGGRDGRTDRHTHTHTDRWTDMMKQIVRFFLILRTCLKMYFPCPPHEGIEEVLRSFVACALDKGEWLNLCPGHFMSRMKPPDY
jgi:hypothetical protein